MTCHERNLPLCFIAVIKNWYDKLTSVVKWNSVFSMLFVVRSGVRQGGILSPILFNVYVNDLVNNLVDKDCGCHVGSVFFGCFIYADDVILLSPSLIGLQAMLDVCACYGNTHDIIFNSKKSVCMVVGKSVIAPLPSMSIGDDNINWVKSLKYLGVTFVNISK